MIVSLNARSMDDLETIAGHLSYSANFFREQGEYLLAAQVKSRAQEINQHLLRREADHRQYVARQLSLVPPGTYDEPA